MLQKGTPGEEKLAILTYAQKLKSIEINLNQIIYNSAIPYHSLSRIRQRGFKQLFIAIVVCNFILKRSKF